MSDIAVCKKIDYIFNDDKYKTDYKFMLDKGDYEN